MLLLMFNFPLTEVLCECFNAEEIKEAVTVLASHHPQSGWKWNGQIDLVLVPMSGFSLSRQLAQRRAQQFIFFYRLVTELSPRYFVMENVPGMAGKHKTWTAAEDPV